MDEMSHLLAALGLRRLANNRAEVEFLVKELDADGSGSLDFDEFYAWYRSSSSSSSSSR